MTRDKDSNSNDAGLWARARDAWRQSQPQARAPDPLTLAAYLDGSLIPEQQERVEAWMASSPEALNLVIAARENQRASPGAVPDSLLSRARGLVHDRSHLTADGQAQSGFGAWLNGLLDLQMLAWRPVAWAGVASVMLMVSAGSFELGRQGALNLAPLQTAEVEDLGLGLDDSADELL